MTILQDAQCVTAQFVFNEKSGLALYLEFEFEDYNNTTSFYVTELNALNDIKKFITKGRTGFAGECFDTNDLKKLLGKNAKIIFVAENNQCYFAYWVDLK